MSKATGTVISVLIALGLALGIYFGRYFINKVDDPHTRINNGEAVADKYIANCDTIHLTIKNYMDTDVYFKVKGASNTASSNTIAYVSKYVISFYDDSMKKHFAVYYFFKTNSFLAQSFSNYTISELDKAGTPIACVVNKAELNDPSYGTEQKPVPILYFYTIKRGHDYFYSLTQEGTKSFEGNENEFKNWILNYNASHYLSYVKPKADFDKMFGATN
jgi:hypothetical protein